MKQVAWLVGASVLLGWHPLVAQDVATRRSIDSFRDTVRQLNDVRTLDAMLRVADNTLRHDSHDAAVKVRQGFLYLRRGEVEQRRDAFDQAQDAFNDVVSSMEPSWQVARLGRGLARLNQTDQLSTVGRSVQKFFDGNPTKEAARDFNRGATTDSSYRDGLLQLSDIALADYHKEHLDAALEALRAVDGAPISRDTLILLARVRVERVEGHNDSATVTVHSLLARAPDNPGALMEAGHLALLQGDVRGGGELWFRGLTLADSATELLYRSDLVPVFPATVMTQFDQAAGAARTRIVREFLETDDPLGLRSAAERLREHYLRLDRARMLYPLPTNDYVADGVRTLVRSGPDMDDRGIVWVLHGEPDEKSYIKGLDTPRNESWDYRLANGEELIFNFMVDDPAKGYQRTPSLLDIFARTRPAAMAGMTDPKSELAKGHPVVTYGATWSAQTIEEILYSRENVSPFYAHMLTTGKKGLLALERAERAAGDSSIAHRETWPLHYELPLEAAVDAVAVGSDSSGTLIQVAYGIPGSQLYAPAGVRPVVYPIRTRVTVLQGSRIVARLDTVRRVVMNEPVDEGGMLYGRLPLPVPAGSYTVRIALETASRGVVVPAREVRVAASGGTALDLSDLALGTRSVRLPFRTAAGDSVWITPTHSFHATEPMQLYFEVHGIELGASYHTDLAIIRDGASHPDLKLGFESRASAAPDPVLRSVDLGRLKPGAYHVDITVIAASGVQVTRRRDFTVVR